MEVIGVVLCVVLVMVGEKKRGKPDSK